MINITKEELNKLEEIGHGGFGIVYKKGDKAYKIFKKEIRLGYDTFKINPVLKKEYSTIQKCNKLIRLNNKIEKTDLIEDIIYIDNNFSGTVMPYYDGVLFYDLKKEPLQNRIEYSKKLIECAKELNKYNIYPTDYKLINMFLYNNEVKLIDLDDVFTKVTTFRNPIYYKKSIGILDSTIGAFFSEGYYNVYDNEIKNRITKKNYKCCKTYEEIEKYIDDKSKKYNLIFIDDGTNLSNLNIDNSKIIYTYNIYVKDKIMSLLDELDEKGIKLYDIIDSVKIDDYINDNMYDECIIKKNKTLSRIR